MTPSPQTLWEFLQAAPFTNGAQQFYALTVSGLVGIVAHYTMKWARGEIAGSLVEYLFKQYPRKTLLTVASYIGFALTTVTTGALEGSSWFTVMWMGLTSGFAVDAVANKGNRQVWSDDKRSLQSTQPRSDT